VTPEIAGATPSGSSAAGGSSPGASTSGYLLDNRQAEAGVRLAAIGELFDAATFRTLDATGISPGWRCWEVGAGGPGVASWLSGRVGLTGGVLVTDIDTSWLADSAWPDGTVPPQVTVARHDVTADPLPDGPFDLVHARLLLVHLPRRTDVASALAGLLTPGGWLVVEDADPRLQSLACIDEYGPEQVLANRIRDGFRSLLVDRGVDLAFGRTLPRLLRSLGLVDVEAEAYFPVTSPVSSVLERATVEQTRAGLVGAGLATDEEVDRHLASLASGRLDVTTAPMVSARGRRPPGGDAAPESAPGGDR
jgi:SAM-dependent methyltransferase